MTIKTAAEHYCKGRIVTTTGINKLCMFRSHDLDDKFEHHCPICGSRLLVSKNEQK